MITKISMSEVASYKKPTSIETDRRVNLLYGLNGTGKSTISNFLANQQNPSFSKCKIEGLDAKDELLVYNEQFIEEHFYTNDEQKGIFTLSKRNADAEKRISALLDSQKKTNGELVEIRKKIDAAQSQIEKIDETARESIWEIKTNYSGGDRVLEYCLDGLKRKENLFAHLSATAAPVTEPVYTVASLKKEVDAVSGGSSSVLTEVGPVEYHDSEICSSPLWSKIIVGNQDSTLSAVIQRLGNSDWVKSGRKFIDLAKPENQICPFCQESTITSAFISRLKLLFDESYDNDTEDLVHLQEKYVAAMKNLSLFESIQDNPVYSDKFQLLMQVYADFKRLVENNLHQIDSKIDSPSRMVTVESLELKAQEMSGILAEINTLIAIHNKKVQNKNATLADIKSRFWSLMRWKYNVVFKNHTDALTRARAEIEAHRGNESECLTRLQTINGELREEQKKTVNISESVERIRNGLLDLGIDGFSIENHKENMYRIVRPGGNAKTFVSLSEGEKMIISFLYFIELCRGSTELDSVPHNKIVVIDDPISSLSHIYVFNISQLIKAHFTSPGSGYSQVFILTHSLYFFYDLTFANKEDRDVHQKLFRITKNGEGSAIATMRYTEVQNDYQAYWQVVKDPDHTPALIANCMRNIIEYFFSFVEKRELSNVFQKEALKATKYQAFYRYINRESHSFGQNIFDMKEFDYAIFTEAFRLVFSESGYTDHYRKMMA